VRWLVFLCFENITNCPIGPAVLAHEATWLP
jgi:hypothetical protein